MWELIITGTISAVVPTALLYVLTRKRDDKKFSLDAKSVENNIFDSVSTRLENLLKRADEQLKERDEKLREQDEKLTAAIKRIDDLEKARDREREHNQTLNRKLDKLRNLLRSYTMRVGIPLTAEEQAIFDETDPEWVDGN